VCMDNPQGIDRWLFRKRHTEVFRFCDSRAILAQCVPVRSKRRRTSAIESKRRATVFAVWQLR